MDIKIDIKPEDVEQMVVTAILNSALGEAVKNEVENAVKELSSTHNSPLRHAIVAEVQKIVMQVVMNEYGDKVREAIRNYLTDEKVNEIALAASNAFWDAADKIRRNGRGY